MPSSDLALILQEARKHKSLYQAGLCLNPKLLEDTVQDPRQSRKLSKFRIMTRYAVGVCCLPCQPCDLGDFNGTVSKTDSILSAYSACHLFGLSIKQMRDTGLLSLMANVWFAIVNLGDDILDEFVSDRISIADAIKMVNEVCAAGSLEDKARIFTERVQPYLLEQSQREIAARYGGPNTPPSIEFVRRAITFSDAIDQCRSISGQKLNADAKLSLSKAISDCFAVALHSYALERTTLASVASPEELIEIYRAKAFYFQYAYQGIGRAYVQHETQFADHLIYYDCRLKNIGAIEMLRSMFRDDVNDLHKDLFGGVPNLVAALAIQSDDTAEFTAMMRAAIAGTKFSMCTFSSLMPQAYQRFMDLQESERIRLGVNKHVLFSSFVELCTNVSSVGWFRTIKHYVRACNRHGISLKDCQKTSGCEENKRLAWLLSSGESFSERFQVLGADLSAGGAQILAELVGNGILTCKLRDIVERYLVHSQQNGNEESVRGWLAVLDALSNCSASEKSDSMQAAPLASHQKQACRGA